MRQRRRILAAALLALLCVAPASAADPLASLSYLVGSWNCTYNAGTQHVKYSATYAYVMGNSWMRERDRWAGSDSDVGLTTYEPKTDTWTEVVLENDRSTTVFRSKGSDGGHRVYQSIYPNALLNLTFDRVSKVKYTLHFHGTYAGKTMTSYDTCTKQM
jgi:opacity protein-like surface antigen